MPRVLQLLNDIDEQGSNKPFLPQLLFFYYIRTYSFMGILLLHNFFHHIMISIVRCTTTTEQ